jgi:hypothetical protein
MHRRILASERSLAHNANEIRKIARKKNKTEQVKAPLYLLKAYMKFIYN